jgi:hypothetical protein
VESAQKRGKMIKNQFIRAMGGICLSTPQLVKLAWLAETRKVSPEQVLSEMVDEYLGSTVPQFSAADRTKLEQEIARIVAKFNKPANVVKADILASKGHRYHLKDPEAKIYRDYLRLTEQ